MRGLFFKIFAIFWLAQSLIFIISTALIVGQHFPTRNIVNDALDSNLHHDAVVAFETYEAAGCAGFSANANRHEPSGAALLDQQGQEVCSTKDAPSIPSLTPHFPGRIDGRFVDGGYVWLVPLTSTKGEHYEYVWFQPPSISKPPPRWRDMLHFAFPQMWVAIGVGGLTTFVLVLLFTRPLVRLRKAARQLAEGDLTARVPEPSKRALRQHSDEFEGLVHDFNHMAERLESQVAAQRLLLRDVSHELRSPLSRLSVALELAREDAPQDRGGHLARIDREAGRLNQLIGQLLTLSSMEAREGTFSFQQLSLNALCEQILPDAEYEAQRRPCSVILEEVSTASIRGNWELLHRAIENVVRNAIRYTKPNSQVTIRVTETQQNALPFVMVEVDDAGPGIPEDQLVHIFRPFYRLDHARSSSTGGFGVGLAITERAVRLHGGIVRAINRPTGGTTIQLLFPAES